MRRHIKLLLCLALLCPVLWVGPVMAAEEGKPPAVRTFGGPEMSGEWSLQMSFSHLPSADVHGVSGDAGLSDYRLKIARNIRLDDRLTLTFGGGYGLKHIDASAQASLPRDLHGLFIEAGARYRINERAFASLRVYPGFYSDFKELGSDDLRMPVLALGGYRFDSGVSLVGGLIYRFGYHSARFIPALGISYQPNDSWRLDLVAPRPAVTWLPSRQLQLFVAGDFASDEYEIKGASGANAMKYSDYKVMGGVSYLPVQTVKLTTAVGYAFDRKFMFFGGNRNDLRVDDVPFVKFSVETGW